MLLVATSILMLPTNGGHDVILAGDIGGTKSNLGLFNLGDLRTPVNECSFHSKDFPGLERIIQEFLLQCAPGTEISIACFGIAGPIVNEACQTPNLPWVITARAIRELLRTDAVTLINDLESTGFGVPLLRSDELLTLNPGAPPPFGNAALIAAGTGLGEATLHWTGLRYEPVASEGGHADFAPRNDLEIDLLKYLIQRFGHVSYERVLSGPGLFNIYSFLKDAGYAPEEPWLTEKLKTSDPSATISQAALASQSELCSKALDMFVTIYGAEAGNLVLKAMAVTGIYVGGGIAPKIIERLRNGSFVKAFADKSRLEPILQKVPVHIILNPKTALYGAANAASQMQRLRS
jgi:glucokinase